MITLTITIEEIRPGVIDMRLKCPPTEVSTLEKTMADVVKKTITEAMPPGCHSKAVHDRVAARRQGEN